MIVCDEYGKRVNGLKVRYIGETDDCSFVLNEIYDVYENVAGRLFAYDRGSDDYYIEENPRFEILDIAAYNALMQLPEYQPHKCPVCNTYPFPMLESYRYCPVCGWYDTKDLRFNHGLSADEYRMRWTAGELGPIERSDHLCPICWKTRFSFSDSKETCSVCGWIDDLAQDQDENAEGANIACKRDYKKAYKSGTLGRLYTSLPK